MGWQRTWQQECVAPECVEGECNRVITTKWEVTGGLIKVCSTYAFPRLWWKKGGCPFLTGIRSFTDEAPTKVRVGQQKQLKLKI